MSEPKELKPGDACPVCGGDFAPDLSQHSAALIDHHKRVAAQPAASARYAEIVAEKIRTSGELQKCRDCGYQTRFGPETTSSSAPGRRRRPANAETDAGAATT